MMDFKGLFYEILDTLKIEEERKLTDEFNIFQYDSFTKVNLILVIESYAENENMSLDALVECDTYQDLIDLTQKMYEEVHQ